jgi:predicted Fe-Mo cluster-binding NifX family protein
MDMLITAGMGERLRGKLRNIGVHVIVTEEIDPDNFINSLL